MYLTKYQTADGSRWAVDGHWLPPSFCLQQLLELPKETIPRYLQAIAGTAAATGALLAPIDATSEVWAAGVTYLRSRSARETESTVRDIYTKVYDAERPELFFKATGWRVAGHRMPIRVRGDSRWNVPEPELTLVINARGEIIGYSAGNDVSSRDIEGENPLYLPQAKIYDGSCALGPGIVLGDADAFADVPIALEVTRDGRQIFQGDTRTSRIVRRLETLAAYLVKELTFPNGVLLMTGTGIVPPDDFSLQRADAVRITVGELTLENDVTS